MAVRLEGSVYRTGASLLERVNLSGAVICIVYFILLKKESFSSIIKKLVLSSTVMVIVLHLASFIIDYAARAMP
ncbi:hypothetical protein [Bacillus glycinifermentans]|uniref:hypothetical protein n=1 Tax=Bacillus glycinifermentans TaxID=1664069 RepID=UPI001FF2DFBA|nr:hypothetical protein [Bacillus glycinifermentans]UOY89306.1 hypothetical protein MW696_03420 [Bacillus glycinifermentans]